jgi:hypothetical protein
MGAQAAIPTPAIKNATRVATCCAMPGRALWADFSTELIPFIKQGQQKHHYWPQKTQETQKGLAEVCISRRKHHRFSLHTQIPANPFCVSCVFCGQSKNLGFFAANNYISPSCKRAISLIISME